MLSLLLFAMGYQGRQNILMFAPLIVLLFAINFFRILPNRLTQKSIFSLQMVNWFFRLC